MKKIIFFRFCLCISESDTVKSDCPVQKTGHFQSFLFIFFFVPPTLGLKKKSRKSTNKKIWPYQCCIFIIALGREHYQHRDAIVALGREHYQHSDVIILFILLILTSDSPPLSTTSGNHNSKRREIYHHWGLSHDLLISSVTNTSSATSRPTHLLSCQPRVTVMQCFVLRIACSSYCLTLTSDSPHLENIIHKDVKFICLYYLTFRLL